MAEERMATKEHKGKGGQKSQAEEPRITQITRIRQGNDF